MKNLILAACAGLFVASMAEAKSRVSTAEASQNALAQSQDCPKKNNHSWNGRSPAQTKAEQEKLLKIADATPQTKRGKGRSISEGP